jgi:branched-subunit amino acid transport protein
VTWGLVIGLAVGAFAFKAIGFFLLGRTTLPPVVERCLALIPAALITALVVKDTFTAGQSLVIDARVAGVAVAAVAVWRRAPFVVVVIAAAGVTAAVRALGWT